MALIKALASRVLLHQEPERGASSKRSTSGLPSLWIRTAFMFSISCMSSDSSNSGWVRTGQWRAYYVCLNRGGYNRSLNVQRRRKAARDEKTAKSENDVHTTRTSNCPVDGLGEAARDAAAESAMLDRLLRHGHLLKCGPRSWRTQLDARGAIG